MFAVLKTGTVKSIRDDTNTNRIDNTINITSRIDFIIITFFLSVVVFRVAVVAYVGFPVVCAALLRGAS